MRKSYKGVPVIAKATLMHISGIYEGFSKELCAAINASGFDENSASGLLVKQMMEKYSDQSSTALHQAKSKMPGRPAKAPSIKVLRTLGRPRKAGKEWEDLVYELVESRRIIQEVFNETNGSAAAAMREIFDERVLPIFNTNAIDTRKQHFGRLESAYKRAKARASKKVQK